MSLSRGGRCPKLQSRETRRLLAMSLFGNSSVNPLGSPAKKSRRMEQWSDSSGPATTVNSPDRGLRQLATYDQNDDAIIRDRKLPSAFCGGFHSEEGVLRPHGQHGTRSIADDRLRHSCPATGETVPLSHPHRLDHPVVRRPCLFEQAARCVCELLLDTDSKYINSRDADERSTA